MNPLFLPHHQSYLIAGHASPGFDIGKGDGFFLKEKLKNGTE